MEGNHPYASTLTDSVVHHEHSSLLAFIHYLHHINSPRWAVFTGLNILIRFIVESEYLPYWVNNVGMEHERETKNRSAPIVTPASLACPTGGEWGAIPALLRALAHPLSLSFRGNNLPNLSEDFVQHDLVSGLEVHGPD